MNIPQNLRLQDYPLPAFSLGERGDIVSVNQALESFSGYREEELLGLAVHVLLPNYPELPSLDTRGHCQPECLALFLLAKDDIKRQTQVYVRQVNDANFVFLSPAADEDQRDQGGAEQSISLAHESEQPYWEWPVNGDKIYYSSRFMDLLGYENKPFTGPASFWKAHIDNTDLSTFNREFEQAFSGADNVVNFTVAITDKLKQKKQVNIQGQAQKNHHNKIFRLTGLMRDVSKLPLLLAHSEKQSRHLGLIEHLSICGHWRFDLVDEKLFWSSGVFKIFGIRPSSYRPSLDETTEFFLPSERDLLSKNIFSAIDSSKGFYFKASIKRPSGKKVKIETIGEVELDCNGHVISIFGLFRDITKSEEVLKNLNY